MTDTVAQAQAAETSDTHQIAINVDSSVATTGLPVAGYKKTQPAHLIALVNENKLLEEKILRQIDKHTRNSFEVTIADEVDQRCVALARTAIQEAFMWLNRGVFQPQRLTGDLD